MLVEVGTTNRTHLDDYRQAIGPATAVLLRVHSSNFRQIGFTAEVSLAELVALGQQHALPVIDDLGSGTLLDTTAFGLAYEPRVQDSVQAGATLVTFSGDKLLGGPQAGLIVGQTDAIARLRTHPLTRALRVDKTTLAGLAATLGHYLRGEAVTQVPVWRMIAASPDHLAERARRWAAQLQASGIMRKSTPARRRSAAARCPEKPFRPTCWPCRACRQTPWQPTCDTDSPRLLLASSTTPFASTRAPCCPTRTSCCSRESLRQSKACEP